MHDFSASQVAPPHQVVRLADVEAGLDGVIVLHSTRLGPAAGGCRLWRYPSVKAATLDAMRLAEAMTYKNALAGLPFGGGKAVIRQPSGELDRAALFTAFGRCVEALDGAYVTAEDVGTSVADMARVATATQHVAGLSVQDGRPGGDPSPFTAQGVFNSMRVAVARHLDRPISDVTVAVQGLGSVGFALCRLLHEAGAKLVVSEKRSALAARAAMTFDAQIASVNAIAEVKADVFAPCALGGAINDRNVARLKAKVICGAANNQLSEKSLGAVLADRDILYAPDYVVNAGGIINVAAEYLGWSVAEVSQRISAIGSQLTVVLDRAEAGSIATNVAADEVAREVISDGVTGLPQAAAA